MQRGERCVLRRKAAGHRQWGASRHLPVLTWKRAGEADGHPCRQRPGELCSRGAQGPGCRGSQERAAWCQFAAGGCSPGSDGTVQSTAARLGCHRGRGLEKGLGTPGAWKKSPEAESSRTETVT